MRFIVVVMLLVLTGCSPAPAPAKMRTSFCLQPQPGVQMCQFTYDGDPKEAKEEEGTKL